MTLAPPVPFPGSRVLAGWWLSLSSFQPVKLWIGHFLFHTLEVPIHVKGSSALARFPRLILQGIALSPDRTNLGLALFLSLEPGLLIHNVRFLESRKLIELDETGSWQLTALGKQANAEGSYSSLYRSRGQFTFLEPDEGSVPIFVPPLRNAGQESTEGINQRFDLSLVNACLHQDDEWKNQHGFPVEIADLVPPFPGPSDRANGLPLNYSAPDASAHRLEDWQRIGAKGGSRHHVLLVSSRGPNESDMLTGFEVNHHQWTFEVGHPLFRLTTAPAGVFRNLLDEPPLDSWTLAWREWGRQRGLPQADVQQGSCERTGHRLKVRVSRRIMDQLRHQRSDAMKGEAWLLAGTDVVRSIAQLEIIEKN